MDLPPRRRNSTRIDEDGNIFWHGVKLGEFWKTDMEVAITKSNRQRDASFSIRVGKTGTSVPYQQTIPINFARRYKNLMKERLTLKGPTGKTWTTVLQDFHNGARFGKGWRQFSKENHLREGYQLLFTLVGRFRFVVQFFDQLGKRCTSYPPLQPSQPGSVPVAEIQCEPDLQPGSQSSFQQGVDAGEARDDPDDLEMEDEELDEVQNDLFHGSDMDEATMQTLDKPKRNLRTWIELLRGKQPKFHSPDNRANSPHIRDHNNSPSSGDELSFQNHSELQKEPVRVRRPAPGATPGASHQEVGGSSRSSSAIRVLLQQGCMRFSQIVLKCERRDVSDQERRVVVDAAKRFISALDDEMFLVVMRDEQVYHTFHLAISEKMLETTGTERNSKVEVHLQDTEQVRYKTYWTRQNFCDTSVLDREAWAKFAVDHSLEEGDVCVFQLLQPVPGDFMPAFLFCVHIFRVVETPVGQLDFSDAIDNN